MQESITLGIVCLARAVQGRACHFFSCRQRHRQEDAVAIPSQRYGAGSSQPLSNDADMLDHEPPLAGSLRALPCHTTFSLYGASSRRVRSHPSVVAAPPKAACCSCALAAVRVVAHPSRGSSGGG
eukprot:TRINITY_DN29097_c0_g1_i6.p1 TRINITY_DN29097_c0_g1~~TRINITY_DN29097_c0_g1_i6.p1  ORF type:complete len:125 (+),score=11.56 TRINITY_DN29097_c0_g1_i6:49-423(+)